MYQKAAHEEQRHKAQVKVWHNAANGISLGMTRIVIDANQDRYTALKDVTSSVFALQAAAFSLQQSLYEERAIDEKEFISEQKELREELKKSRAVQS